MSKKMKLDELRVQSFLTSDLKAGAVVYEEGNTLQELEKTIISPNDPTAATWCYVCPVEPLTHNGCW